MAPLDVDSYGIPSVPILVNFFEEALEAASAIKPEASVEPPLEDADLDRILAQLPVSTNPAESFNDAVGARQRNSSKWAIIETAARGLLSNLIVCDAPQALRRGIPLKPAC